MVPDGWIAGRVGDLLVGLEAGVSVNGEDRTIAKAEKAVLKVSAVTYGVFNPLAAKAIVEEGELERARTNPRKYQIIISRSNTEALVGASAFISKDYPNLFLPDKLWQTVPKSESDMKWLSYFLASSQARYTLSKLATGTSGSMKNITKGELTGLRLLIPSPPEQKKIAQILSTWDKAIKTTEKLIANSQQQKKALMQQLLTGKKRLLDESGVRFSGEWESLTISNFIEENREQGTSGKIAKKLTIKLYGKGVQAKDEKRLGSESTKYYRRRAGQFIYSKLDFLNGAFGVIPSHLDGYESTLDLPAFDFVDGVCKRWFLYFVSRKDFYIANIGLANGGRKARRVNPSDLLTVKVSTPLLEEQNAIAAVLDAASLDIANLQRKLDFLILEKKALMQQLLTGKRRVKVDEVAA